MTLSSKNGVFSPAPCKARIVSAPGHHFLVGVSGSGNSEYLMRWTSMTAERLNATWAALHVHGAASEADPIGLE